MANIIKMIETQEAKGLRSIDFDGNFVDDERFSKKLKKEYLKLSREGEIDIEKVSFSEFKKQEAGNLLSTKEVKDYIMFENTVEETYEEPLPDATPDTESV